MSNGRGYRLRHIETVLSQRNGVVQAIADCGHYIVRLGQLGIGQRVFCALCRSACGPTVTRSTTGTGRNAETPCPTDTTPSRSSEPPPTIGSVRNDP